LLTFSKQILQVNPRDSSGAPTLVNPSVAETMEVFSTRSDYNSMATQQKARLFLYRYKILL